MATKTKKQQQEDGNEKVKKELQRTESWANKYRPIAWDDVCGQDMAVSRLKGMIKKRNIPTGVMLVGATGCGKTTLARMFSRYLNCETNDACGECASCKAMNADNHPDYMELDGASNGGIDKIRELIQFAKLKPRLGAFRVIVVDEFQRVTGPAQEAMLKTLEHPPASTLFIIASMEPEKIKPAVVGRCQQIVLSRVDKDAVVSRLQTICEEESLTLDEDVLTKIADATQGQMRNAVSALQAVSQYIDGLDKKPSQDKLVELVAENLVKIIGVGDDMQALAIVCTLLAKKPKALEAKLLDVEDWIGVVNKCLYMMQFLLGATCAPQHASVWYTPANKKLLTSLAHEKVAFDTKDKANWPHMVKVFQAFVRLKAELGTFAVPEGFAVRAALHGLLIED